MPQERDYTRIARIAEMLEGRRLSPSLRKAMTLQESVKDGEREQLELGVDYSEQQVRLSIVHTRQDLVLVATYLHSIAESNRVMTGGVVLIGWIALLTFVTNVIVWGLKAAHWWPWPF